MRNLLFLLISISQCKAIAEYIVVLHPTSSLTSHLHALSFSAASYEITRKFQLDSFKAYTIEFPEHFSGSQADQHLPESSDIWFIEKNQRVSITPQVSTASQSAAIANEETLTSTIKVQANANWNLARISQHVVNDTRDNYYYPSSAGAGVDVYILDTGVMVTHEEFETATGSRATLPVDFTQEGLFDGNGHGTHVSGIVAGTTYGVAKLANIIGVKVLDSSGSGDYATIIQGVLWAANATKVSGRKSLANMSISGPMSKALDAAITGALKSGLLFVVAAGNYGTDACLTSPGDTSVAIVVSATNANDVLAAWSNHGKCVTLSAPGVNITSSYMDGGSKVLEGTSQASPHVAGAVALLFAEDPKLEPDHVKAQILLAATKGVISGITDNTENAMLFTVAPTISQASMEYGTMWALEITLPFIDFIDYWLRLAAFANLGVALMYYVFGNPRACIRL